MTVLFNKIKLNYYLENIYYTQQLNSQ